MNDTHFTVDDSLPQSVMEQVDSVCDRFEDAWLAGQRPRIEDFLAEVSDERVRQALVKELIALDIYHRQKLGETILPRDYERFSPPPANSLVATAFETPAAPQRYRFGEKVGVGGMGEVCRGRDLRLDRELAIKVLLQKHKGETHLERRFLEEARIGGRLQHPGIVPVHDLGELSDGRPFFTMKLVEGRTLVALLDERPEPSQDLPRFLTIFEQICQTLAYAHAQGVIHRDLKPANVMVGAFGEVQVMDWGLAKVLKRSSVEEADAGRDTVVYRPVEEDTSWQMRTQQGEAMGTYAYMPPEQARGEIERVNQRSDVFGLGAILCEILTGRPPFSGRDRSELFTKAKTCAHAEAMARLDACGADAELLQLARTCLAAKPEDRPRNAGAVAESVKSYLTGVQERLRAAERERAAAQARAEEARRTVAAERRARRRMVWAALAMLLLIVGAGGGAWWQQWKQERTDKAVENGLGQAEMLEKQAKEAPLEPGKYGQALEAARVAAELAKGASDDVRARADELVARLEREKEAAEQDRRLLTALLEVHSPHEGPKFKVDDKGMMMTLAEPTAEEQFASAFRDWGLDVEAVPAKEAATLLKARPAAVVTEVIAALDEWASQLRQHRKPEAAERVTELAVALDDNPGSLRRELREILSRRLLPVERALSELSAALRPVPVPVEVPLGKDRLRLRQLAEKTDSASEPILGLLTLTRALRVAGEEAMAERLLRAALTARPQEVVLYQTLADLLTTQTPPRWGEAVEFYRAARGLRPNLGVMLAWSLLHNGHAAEGLALLARMVRESPDNPYLHFQRGWALGEQRRHVGAEIAFRKAIELKPDYADAYNSLGTALAQQGRALEAEATYRKGIALKPDFAPAYGNLSGILSQQGKPAEAEAACRKAIELKPDYAEVYVNLGLQMRQQGRPLEAEEAYRKAIALKPDLADAYINLGALLCDHQGKPVEAEAAFRKAIALKPDDFKAYTNLGIALAHQGKPVEAEAASRRAIVLKADYADAYNNLGNVLNDQGKHAEAETAFRKAIALKPDFAEAYASLGALLNDHQGKHVEAEAAFRKAIALKPNFAGAYVNLGVAQDDQGKHAEAEATYRKIIALKPDDARAYSGLGAALNHQGKHAEAEAACREAIALKPDYAGAYVNLGNALSRLGKPADAEAVCRKAIELKPDEAKAYVNLGVALNDQGKHAEAEIACHKAIALKPDYADGYFNLGIALGSQGKPVEAEAANRKAIALKPDEAKAYNNLGAALSEQGKHGEAEPAFRKAIALKPDYALAHCNLGDALQHQGRFTEALLAFQRGHELGSKQPGWRYPSPQKVRTAERLVKLAKKLPSILNGEASPTDPGEAVSLAWMCQQPYQKRYAASARLYADAFAAEPMLAANNRYNAACSAALAAAGKGEDARSLPDKAAAMFRRWALRWLRDDLTAYGKIVEQNNPTAKRAIQQQLVHWQGDPDLAGLRDKDAVDKLPPAERDACRKLWADVADLLKRAQDK